jgi:hypothetical protein
MRNERGNVIALVLLILAVVSLVGAGALMMSRYDLKFTAALKSYDKGFNLADGGATVMYRYLAKLDPEQTLTGESAPLSTLKEKPPTAQTKFCHCADPANCSSESTKATCTRCVDRAAGDYDAKVQFVDYTNETTSMPGWESGGTLVFWNGLGVSERAPGKIAAKYQTANSTVQANVARITPSSN